MQYNICDAPIMYSHARYCIYDYNNETYLKSSAVISKSLNKDSQLK